MVDGPQPRSADPSRYEAPLPNLPQSTMDYGLHFIKFKLDLATDDRIRRDSTP